MNKKEILSIALVAVLIVILSCLIYFSIKQTNNNNKQMQSENFSANNFQKGRGTSSNSGVGTTELGEGWYPFSYNYTDSIGNNAEL